MRASIVSIAAGLALLAAGAASAQGYVGGAFGRTNASVDCSGTLSCDKTSSGGKLYGGYMLGPQFSVELGYFDWGKASATELPVALGREMPKDTGSVTVSGRLKTTGFGLPPPVAETMNGASPNIFGLSAEKLITCGTTTSVTPMVTCRSNDSPPAPTSVTRSRTL